MFLDATFKEVCENVIKKNFNHGMKWKKIRLKIWLLDLSKPISKIEDMKKRSCQIICEKRRAFLMFRYETGVSIGPLSSEIKRLHETKTDTKTD